MDKAPPIRFILLTVGCFSCFSLFLRDYKENILGGLGLFVGKNKTIEDIMLRCRKF